MEMITYTIVAFIMGAVLGITGLIIAGSKNAKLKAKIIEKMS